MAALMLSTAIAAFGGGEISFALGIGRTANPNLEACQR